MPYPQQEVLLFKTCHKIHLLLFLALLGFPPGLTAGPRWFKNTEHLVEEAAPPCALLLQHHCLPWEWMEHHSLNFTCKERTPGCPSLIRVPSRASQRGCTDFMLLQAWMAGKMQGNCMQGHYPTDGGDSLQRHKTTSFSKMLAHMVDVSFHVSLGTSFLEEKVLNKRHWMPARASCAQCRWSLYFWLLKVEHPSHGRSCGGSSKCLPTPFPVLSDVPLPPAVLLRQDTLPVPGPCILIPAGCFAWAGALGDILVSPSTLSYRLHTADSEWWDCIPHGWVLMLREKAVTLEGV